MCTYPTPIHHWLFLIITFTVGVQFTSVNLDILLLKTSDSFSHPGPNKSEIDNRQGADCNHNINRFMSKRSSCRIAVFDKYFINTNAIINLVDLFSQVHYDE